MNPNPTAPLEQNQVAPAATGIVDAAVAWAEAAGTRAKLISELALAEAKLAAISLALMACLAMLVAAFVLTAWGLLIAGLIFGLVQLQIPLWPILLGLGGLHVLIALVAWRSAVRLSNNLEFGYTRQQFSQHRESGDELAATTEQG